MNVYLRELSLAMSRFPKTYVDIFTRIQNPEIRSKRNIFPRARVIHLKGGPEYPVDRRFLLDYVSEFYSNLERFIADAGSSYDLVYSHYWLSGLIGERLSKKYNLPLVHAFHTLAFMKKKAAGDKYVEHEKRLVSEKFLAHASRAVISSSEQEKHELVREYEIPAEKIRVIHPGVNKGVFYPLERKKMRQELGFNKDSRIILYVGRIEPVKGLLTLVEALDFLRNKAPVLYGKIRLVVIGGGRKSEHVRNSEILSIQKEIRDRNLADKVFFVGSKEQNQLRKYYSASDVLVMPSLYESFGLVVIEALACGTPVLVSKMGEMVNIVKEGRNGYYFTPGDFHSLSSCLVNLFSQKNNLWPIEDIRKDVITRFSWEKTAQESHDFLREVVIKSSHSTTIFPPDENPQPV